MNLARYFKIAERFVQTNSPHILTGAGVVGVVATAVLTGKATVKATRIHDAQTPAEWEPGEKELAWTSKIKLTWKLYLPAASAGVLTITSIVLANRIGAKRAAAVAAAYSLSEKAFAEYRDKMVDTLGDKEEQKVRDDILQKQVSDNPSSEVHIVGSGETLFWDTISGRYFKSDVETVRRAANDVCHEVNHNMYASLAFFYELIGLSNTPFAHEIGWNGNKMLDIGFSAVFGENNEAVIALDYKPWPISNFTSSY